jgi:F0F1-type ATP synthase membrane subunit c/vacuolar-type H+-ATPase subunit K
MILRVIGVGMLGVAVASATAGVAAGVLAAVAVRACAKRRAAWPREESAPADDAA